jgi:cell pole-organizing protein PopZ
MTQPAKVQEPSMEEILASIRRIIADDEAKPPIAEKAAGSAASAKPEKSVAAAPAV